MVERQLGTLEPGMVRIRFGAGGICGSDMHYFRHARTGDFVVTRRWVLGQGEREKSWNWAPASPASTLETTSRSIHPAGAATAPAAGKAARTCARTSTSWVRR